MRAHAKVLKHKVGLLKLADALGNVAHAGKVRGDSRATCYRDTQAVNAGGFEALVEQSRRTPNLRHRGAAEIEDAAVALAMAQPASGQGRASNELRTHGHAISPAGGRGVWQRPDLESWKTRLKALETQVAAAGPILTEGQLAALEQHRRDDEAAGEIATAQPGYLGSQDTFDVGLLLCALLPLGAAPQTPGGREEPVVKPPLHSTGDASRTGPALGVENIRGSHIGNMLPPRALYWPDAALIRPLSVRRGVSPRAPSGVPCAPRRVRRGALCAAWATTA